MIDFASSVPVSLRCRQSISRSLRGHSPSRCRKPIAGRLTAIWGGSFVGVNAMTTHNEWGQFNPIHNHPDGRECSACAEWKEWKNFGLDKKMASGRRSQCRKCCALRQRDNPRTAKQNHDAYLRRKDKHGYIPNYDKAAWARSVVQAAIRRGELTRPDKCPECNESDRQIEAHHDDYDKPLEVEWICSRCHKRTKHVQY